MNDMNILCYDLSRSISQGHTSKLSPGDEDGGPGSVGIVLSFDRKSLTAQAGLGLPSYDRVTMCRCIEFQTIYEK